ncbi:MAG: hypothetical protein R3240_04560, partial [Gammaproteobacteria bacterium]|nr:hypothetical protein [Gammaproteobacteria bacterium]
ALKNMERLHVNDQPFAKILLKGRKRCDEKALTQQRRWPENKMEFKVRHILCSFITTGFALLMGCAQDNNVSVSVNAPQLKPPVENATPKAMLSSVVASKVSARAGELVVKDAEYYMNVIKSRFFAEGPTAFLDRLSKVDERVKSLDNRSKDAQASCLLETAQSKEMAASLPTAEIFPMYFQCSETLDAGSEADSLQINFGKNDETFYLSEVQVNSDVESMGVFAKSDLAGNEVELWFITSQQAGFQTTGVTATTLTADEGMYLHVKANRTTKEFELSVGGNSRDTGVTCGVQMRSKGSYIYATGIFNDPQGLPDGCNEAAQTFCVNAETFAVEDASVCADAGIDAFTLEAMNSTTEGLGANAATITGTNFTGLTDFKQTEN